MTEALIDDASGIRASSFCGSLPVTCLRLKLIASMHLRQRWEKGEASDVSLILGSPQDRLLTAQTEASERLSLPHIHAPSRRLLSLEKRRGDNIYPPLDVFEHHREPRCPKELVRAFPMAGGMKPYLVLVHRLCAHRHIYFLVAPSTDRVRDERTVLHEPTLLLPHSREHAMTRTQCDRTSPLCLVQRKQGLCALVAGLLGLCMCVKAGLRWDSRGVIGHL